MVGSRDAVGILFGGQQEWVRGDHSIALAGDLLQQKAHRHQVVSHARAQHLFGLGKDARNLVQTRDVVLIKFHAAEGRGERQIGQLGVRAAHLRDGHLEVLEGVVLIALLEGADKKFVGENILLRKARGRNSLQARQELLVRSMISLNLGQGSVIQLVVVAVVPVRRRSERGSFQLGLVLLCEKSILRRETRGDRIGSGGEIEGS